MGHTIAPPRLTVWAYVYVVLLFIGPFLLILALVDLALFFFFQEVLDSCYGVFCLLEGSAETPPS